MRHAVIWGALLPVAFAIESLSCSPPKVQITAVTERTTVIGVPKTTTITQTDTVIQANTTTLTAKPPPPVTSIVTVTTAAPAVTVTTTALPVSTTAAPTSSPSQTLTPRPTNTTITTTSTPTSLISSVILKVQRNDKTALVFGFDFLDATAKRTTFKEGTSARFVGSIWQGHLGGVPISYVVKIDVILSTSDDTITVPYSVQNFSGLEAARPVNFDFRIEGTFSNVPDRRYWFQMINDPSVVFTGTTLQLPSTIVGKVDDG